MAEKTYYHLLRPISRIFLFIFFIAGMLAIFEREWEVLKVSLGGIGVLLIIAVILAGRDSYRELVNKAVSKQGRKYRAKHISKAGGSQKTATRQRTVGKSGEDKGEADDLLEEVMFMDCLDDEE